MLLRSGFRVTVLEARNRLGGRIFQERLPNGHLIDVGANWIHGTTDNPIMDLVKETKTIVGVWDNRSYVFDEDGKLLPLEEGEKYSTLMWNIIEDAFEYSNKHGAEIDAEKSLLDFFQEQVPKRIPDTEEGFERQRHILLQMAELWGNFVGSPLCRQSLKFFWLEECIEGGKTEPSHCHSSHAPALTKLQKTSFAREHTTKFWKGLLNRPSMAPTSATKPVSQKSTASPQHQMTWSDSKPQTRKCSSSTRWSSPVRSGGSNKTYRLSFPLSRTGFAKESKTLATAAWRRLASIQHRASSCSDNPRFISPSPPPSGSLLLRTKAA